MKEKYPILYVDDEPINLLVFEKSFEAHFRVISAGSGMEGLELLKKHPEIELIISDLLMPNMNGIEFITLAKQNRPNLKCFILTAYDMNQEIHAALEKQLIEKYFQKPLDIKAILQGVSDSFSR